MIAYDLDQIANRRDLGELLDRDDVIVVPQQVYDVKESDNGKKIVMDYDGDWSVVIPSGLSEHFFFSVSHKSGNDDEGSLIPSGESLIDGESEKKLQGKSEASLFLKDDNWIVESQYSFIDEKNLGKSKNYEFSELESIEINHNLGRMPITEVWVELEGGERVKSNVEVIHDWETKNKFTANFETPQSGVIIYI